MGLPTSPFFLLPFEEPTRYLFVINLKTAKTIRLKIPAPVLALTDEVIEQGSFCCNALCLLLAAVAVGLIAFGFYGSDRLFEMFS